MNDDLVDATLVTVEGTALRAQLPFGEWLQVYRSAEFRGMKLRSMIHHAKSGTKPDEQITFQ